MNPSTDLRKHEDATTRGPVLHPAWLALDSAPTPLRDTVYAEGRISTARLRNALGLSLRELARLSGLPYDSVRKSERADSAKVQRRLQDWISILDRVTPWAGSLAQALAWYSAHEIPALGMTAEQAVRMGRSDYVWAHIEDISQGSYA